MNQLFQDEQAIMEVTGDMPAVSIVMPFYPVMSSKSKLEHDLKLAVEKVTAGLLKNYEEDIVFPVIDKLKQMIFNLNYNTHKKSIALFVSPLLEKVFYLDIPVEEKIVVNAPFEIRDLVNCKKQPIQYLVLLLSAERSKIYLGNCAGFVLIKSNIAAANFLDPVHRKEAMLEKFLHHMDTDLSLILNSYPFPVFVIGTERVTGHFRKLTHHEKNIAHYIHGSFINAPETEIRTVLQPYVGDWQQLKQSHLLGRLEAAAGENRLAIGIRDAWDAASKRNGQLLIVEKGFSHDSEYKDHPFYIKDELDEIMAKVLEGGGDVEFVENGMLKEYRRIALIRYY